MEFHDAIADCQRILYVGFTSTPESGIEWLNDVCLHLATVCRHLHKILVFSTDINETVVDSCLLCTNQLIRCVQQLECTLTVEQEHSTVLPTARQHFLDRMLWCLDRLKPVNNSGMVHTVQADDANFVNYMDIALELVAPMAIFSSDDSHCSNFAAKNAEIMLESTNIRVIIDSLIGQALAFANVALPEDLKPLKAVCQKVLKECIDFQQECSLDQTVQIGDEQSRRLRAAALENALYQLDNLVNDCLLRLVLDVFVELNENPLTKLRSLVVKHTVTALEDDKLLIEAQANSFDELSDKLQQIGVIAAAFASNQRVKSTIRSCLASAESLEPYLIPSIISISGQHALILESHWRHEMSCLQETIQSTIDTKALCSAFIDHLQIINVQLSRQWDDTVARTVLDKCVILIQHFRINRTDLELDLMQSKRRLCYENFQMMIAECRAAIEHELSDRARILKRFKVLRCKLKKFKATLCATPTEDFTFGNVSLPESGIYCGFVPPDQSLSMMAAKEDSLIKDAEYFKAHGIKATSYSILYESKRNGKGLMQQLQESPCSPQIATFKRVRGRSSLRTALFKKAATEILKNSTTYSTSECTSNESMDLQITEILDQITDLSCTLSKSSRH